jgi:hypothetical protein
LFVAEDSLVDAVIVIDVVIVHFCKLKAKHNLNTLLLVQFDQAIIDIRISMQVVLWACDDKSSTDTL